MSDRFLGNRAKLYIAEALRICIDQNWNCDDLRKYATKCKVSCERMNGFKQIAMEHSFGCEKTKDDLFPRHIELVTMAHMSEVSLVKKVTDAIDGLQEEEKIIALHADNKKPNA